MFEKRSVVSSMLENDGGEGFDMGVERRAHACHVALDIAREIQEALRSAFLRLSDLVIRDFKDMAFTLFYESLCDSSIN